MKLLLTVMTNHHHNVFTCLKKRYIVRVFFSLYHTKNSVVFTVCVKGNVMWICLVFNHLFINQFHPIFDTVLHFFPPSHLPPWQTSTLINIPFCLSPVFHLALLFQLLHCCFGSYSWHRLLQRCGTLHWGKLNLSHSSHNNKLLIKSLLLEVSWVK